MTTLEELTRRVEALEAREAAEITDLKKRIATLERWKGDSYTALGKLLPIVEETRLRVSAVELGVGDVKSEIGQIKSEIGQIKSEIGQIKAEQSALRRDLPEMLVNAIREARS